jgi:hypothetical protein
MSDLSRIRLSILLKTQEALVKIRSSSAPEMVKLRAARMARDRLGRPWAHGRTFAGRNHQPRHRGTRYR